LTTPGKVSIRRVFSAHAGDAAEKKRTVMENRKYRLTGMARTLLPSWPHGFFSNVLPSLLAIFAGSPL
jgi:hypothetical protein